MEQAAQQQDIDNKELIYPFPAKPAGGQVNTFDFLTYLLIESEILKCIFEKKIENQIH
jgi:hypothetical protein